MPGTNTLAYYEKFTAEKSLITLGPGEVARDGVGLVVQALQAAELGVPGVAAPAPRQHPREAAGDVVQRPVARVAKLFVFITDDGIK